MSGRGQTWTSILVLRALGGLVSGADESAPAAPVPLEERLEESIRRGITFLLEDQNKDGSWGSAHHTKGLNIYAPAPGAHHAFRSAVTAMCISALIDSGAADQDDRAKAARLRGEAWLLKHLPELRRADPTAIYNVWGHCYGIDALTRLYLRETVDPARREKIKQLILSQMELLGHFESVDGGWGYYDFRVGSERPASSSTSFVTAAVLVAFHDAKEAGIEIPEDILKRGVASINRQRKIDNTYVYGEYLKMQPMRGINRAAGSLGRSQACNLALRLWGDETITEAVLQEWLTRLVKRNNWLSFGRKRPIPHESWFQVAGYFYYFGHYYAARCIDELEVAGVDTAKHKKELAGILLPLQEKDGSWWDFPLYNYHRPYGTAFALMSLKRCRSHN